MKSLNLTILVTFFSLITFNGCASLGLSLPWDLGGSSAEADDPVAEAARQLRDPASTPSLDPDEPSWSRRSAPVDSTIRYGMQMSDVASIWGLPTYVESAGNSLDGNQRWTWSEGLSGRYGLGSKRIVYFESGKVVGWKQQ